MSSQMLSRESGQFRGVTNVPPLKDDPNSVWN